MERKGRVGGGGLSRLASLCGRVLPAHKVVESRKCNMSKRTGGGGHRIHCRLMCAGGEGG